MEFTAQQLAQYIGGTVEGNPEACVNTFAKIEEGVAGALSFFYDPKFEPYVYQTQSSVILVPTTFQLTQPVKATLVRVDDPRMAIGKLLALYESMKPKRTGIDPLAYVAPTAKIGKDVFLALHLTYAMPAIKNVIMMLLIVLLFWMSFFICLLLFRRQR